MTNEQIVFSNRMTLMEQGVIGTTGRTVKVADSAGNVFCVEEPEEIHTYQMWKSLGYQVRKGQKAVASFAIWKHVTKKKKEDQSEEDGEEKGRMFMKVASFFSASQVDAIQTA